MRTPKYFLDTLLAALLICQPWVGAIAANETQSHDLSQLRSATQSDSAPRELSGYMDERGLKQESAARTEGALMGEDGQKVAEHPFASLPVIDKALATKVDSSKSNGNDIVRLIVHLDYLPHAAVLEGVLEARKVEVAALEDSRKSLLAKSAKARDVSAKVDALNYVTLLEFEKSYKDERKALSERHEALSLAIKNAAVDTTKSLVAEYQLPIREAFEALGGTVEFATAAGNLLVVSAELNMINAMADISGVSRIVEDSLMQGDLETLAQSTLVDPPDTSLQGLWDVGLDGGIYDPAIIDSGIDQSHPGLEDSLTPLRQNFSTWYLVAASGDANFDDEFSVDDVAGHGTQIAGVLGNYGSAGFADHLGLAYGVEKMVNLKAAFRRAGTSSVSMYFSDKYQVVDRALYNTEALQGGDFLDDVDGMNLSFGGSTTAADTDAARFWDSVIDTYSDLPVTVSMRSRGGSSVSDPGLAYNVISVANANDFGTATRTDDALLDTSSVGPTPDGRRKPDLAAYGTNVSTSNHDWETGPDYVNRSGASIAAPGVLGVIMDLADAAVFDELSVKALLINTAQKNLPGINFEDDFDGWDPAAGWGVINAYEAYYHRFDIFQDGVEPRGTVGEEYQLYRGVMRDEGSAGQGRDRATMVWNRSATYSTAAPPTTYYGLNDLNLRLYGEETNVIIDSDLGGNDNVHQVRIGSGAPETPVVIRAYAWSEAFADGASEEQYALATEEGFERVDRPDDFQAIALWPTSVEPNEEFDITFWIRNDSEVASHNNTFNLELPAGFTLVSGTDTQNVGSAAAGGITTQVQYTVRAPASPVGASTISVKHSHNSYGIPYGDFNWNMGTTVEVDDTPPNPDPMTFSAVPDGATPTSIMMQATFAADIHQPVQYYLDYMSSPTGGSGGSDSGWQESRDYEDSSMQVNHEYCYRAWARDAANFPNVSTPSSSSCAYTEQETPAGITIGSVTTSSIEASSNDLPANLSFGDSGLQIRNTQAGTSTAWATTNDVWTSSGLAANSEYRFVAVARNGDGDETPESPAIKVFTLANPPAGAAFGTSTSTSNRPTIGSNGNPSATQYLIQNTTLGTDSGWMTNTQWNNTGLDCGTAYNYQVKARNGNGVETINVSLGVASTGACATNDAPQAGADVYSIAMNTSLSGDVGLNDTDPNGDPLTFSNSTLPLHGGLVFNSDGTFTYTPDAGYIGDDSFDYEAGDGEDTDLATVSITVGDLIFSDGFD